MGDTPPLGPDAKAKRLASARAKTRAVGALLAAAKRASSHGVLSAGASSSTVAGLAPSSSEAAPTSSALGSRASSRLSGTYVYFLILEGSWLRCLALSGLAYGIAVCLCCATAVGLELVNSNEELEYARGHDANQFELALRFAAAHIITMASGAVVPVASIGHFVAVVQQLLGVAVNVLVLSAIIAKFQSPTADVVWSSRGVVRDRDGVPTVQFRVGNLRCNKLFPHEISLTLLRRHVTKEGEAYSRRDELEVARPTTISGVHTVAHAIDENSPLYDLLRDGTLEEALGEDDPDEIASPSDTTEIRPSEVHVAEREGAERASPSLRREPSSRKRRRRRTLLVHATMRAYDDVFKGDVVATATYGAGSLTFGGKFSDVISFGADGVAAISWERFDDVVRPRSGVRSAFRGDGSSEGVVEPESSDPGSFAMEGDAEPSSVPSRGKPRLTCGCARASYGDAAGLDNGAPMSPLVPYCPYSSRLGLLLAEGGVDWELVRVDYVRGAQAWYKAAYAPADAPAMQGVPGGDPGSPASWVGGSATCRENAIAADTNVRAAAEVRAEVSEAEVTRWAEALIFGGLAPRLVGTRETKGRKVLAFMLRKTLGEEGAARFLADDGSGAEPDAGEACRAACRAAFVDGLKNLARVLESREHAGEAFLAPDGTPDPSDFVLGGAVVVCKSLLLSGLADVPGNLDGFDAFGAEVLNRYLANWCARPSWSKTYGDDIAEGVNAAIVRSFAAKISNAAGDACPQEKVRGPCNRARRLDPRYKAFMTMKAALSVGEREKEDGDGNEDDEDEGFMSASICV